jgi:hypothetical protein
MKMAADERRLTPIENKMPYPRASACIHVDLGLSGKSECLI